MDKRWLWGGLGASVLIGLAAALAGNPVVSKALDMVGLGKKEAKADVALEFVPTEVAHPQRVALARRVQFSGPLVAPNTAVVRSKAAGTLLSLSVAEGQRVQAGQVIGNVDATEMASRIAERRAMLESARAQAAQAERTHANNQRLADQQFISPAALDSSRANLQTAQAQVAAAQAQLDTVNAARRENTLIAPITGIVAKRHVLPGEKLAVEQPVVALVDLKRLELAGSVGTHEVAALAPGLPVHLQVEGVDRAVAGVVARIAPAAEAGTRSIGVTVAVDNPDEALRAGQYALANASLADPTPRLTLPVGAVVNSGGQDQVWVIDGGVLTRRAVTTGRRDERAGLVEIVDGLQPGATVLALRFDTLREGQKAVVVAQKTTPQASAAASR